MKRVEPISLVDFRAAMKRLRGVPLGHAVTAVERAEYDLMVLRNKERKLRSRECKCGCGRVLSRSQAAAGGSFWNYQHARFHQTGHKPLRRLAR